MAQISNCLKLLSKIDERDQDALVARLDELQAQGVPAEKAQIQAAIDVLMRAQADVAGIQRSAARDVTETLEFKRWSGGAPLVRLGESHEYRSGQPVVVEALHGTTNSDLTEFKRERANIESDWGAGFYASNTPDDVATNYANNDGADLTQRIELLAERLASNEFDDDMDAAREEAKKRLTQESPNTLKLYVRMSNPAVQGGPGETFFDYTEEYDEEADSFGEPTGKLVDFVESLRNVAYEFNEFDADAAMADVWNDATDSNGISLTDLVAKLKASNAMLDAADDDGNIASSEAIRRALEGMGFDGVIDTTVYDKFGPKVRRSGQLYDRSGGMKGMDEDTVHFIAFDPTQLKSATGNRGTFNPEDADITRSAARQIDTPEFRRWFADSKVVDADGNPLVVYHGTGGDFSAFDPQAAPKSYRSDAGKQFFTDSPDVASEYAQDAGSGANVMPVYLSMKNPRVEETEGSPADWWDANGDDLFWRLDVEGSGHDGVIVRGPDSTMYVTSSPNKIKSAIGNRGTFDPADADITRSIARPAFYSQLQRSIEQVPDRIATMAAPQWKLWLDANASKLGIKKDEIEWSGITDYLKLRGKDKVSREDLVAYLGDSGVRVQEVVLGSTGLRDTGEMYVAEANDWGDEWAVFTEDGSIIGDTYKSQGDAEQAMGEMNANGKPTKYGSYTVPGGENYREVLITLPERNVAVNTAGWTANLRRAKSLVTGLPEFEVLDADGDVVGVSYKASNERDAIEMVAARDGLTKEQRTQYKSSHWDATNVLAHIRVDDRVDADGNKVLFLQEIQSDWGQSMKKNGPGKAEYRVLNAQGTPIPEVFATMNDAEARVSGKEGWEIVERRIPGVPDGPFITDTKAWASLALKRAIMMAVEGGHDRVALINGRQAADLYDLSKQVEAIEWTRRKDGTYDISAFPSGGGEAINKDRLSLDAVSDFIGKELADRISKDPGEALPLDWAESTGLLKGIDLKVGGEGMRAFYDEIIPQVARDVLKKLGGGSLTTAAITEDPNVELDKWEPADGEGDGSRAPTTESQNLAFDITPAMREKAASGVPLFSKTRPQSANESYSEDLYGQPLDTKPESARVSRDVQRKPRVRDTDAPKGIYHINTVVAIERKQKLGAKRITNAAELAAATAHLRKSAVERFDGVVTDAKGKPLAIVGSFKGALSQAAVYPSTIIAEAVRVPGAARIWFSHNHPSGTPSLSPADHNLYKTLANAFSGSGIEPMGLIAVARDRFGFTSGGGEIIGSVPDAIDGPSVYIYERDLAGDDPNGLPVLSTPEIARNAAKGAYAINKEPGVLLLDSQHRVVAVVPIDPEIGKKLRGTGGLNSIFRSVSQSNAGAAIIYHAGEYDLNGGGELVSPLLNIGAALNLIDVRPLDAINVATNESRAEQGLAMAAGPVFSKGRTASGADWESPGASKFDDLVYKFQDKQIEAKRVVEAIKEAAGAISDDLNVYLNEELYHGRTAKRTEDFLNMELNPLIADMAKANMKIADLEEFLHARHAKEANAVIAQRNPGEPGLQDGGSGMTNSEADNYMATLPAADRKVLEAAAAKVDAIIAGTRKMFVDYELESQATVDGWNGMFKHYVPLQREDKEGSPGLGQGFSIKGKETKGRTGSTRKVVDILANIAMQRERAIVRGEKNRVAQSLVGLVRANENPDFWLVDEVPTERVFNPATGLVEDRVDPMYKSRDNAVVAKIKDPGGAVREHAVLFNEEDPRALRMAQALKNLDAPNLEGLLGVSAKITRYFAAISTQYNPVFGVVNLVRDVQGAMLNLSSTPLKDDKAKIAKYTASALAGIYGDMRAARKGQNPSSQWARLWDEFQEVGGQTGYRDLFATSADRAEAIQKALDPNAWMDSKLGKVFTAGGALKVPLAQAQKQAGFLFDWLSDYNNAMENGVRLAAYKAGLERGLSKQQAASAAKNLTTNFNRKGQAAQQAGAMYAFFNAAIQGTARIGQTLFDMEPGKPKTLRLSSTGKKIVYGGIMLGSIQALALAAAGFGEEDPPEFARERNLIIPTGGKTYVSIPMPLGMHIIPNIGRVATEFVLSGFKDPIKRSIGLAAMFADAFNPIGNAGMSMQTLAPTALDPLVALTENKDWTGRPIAKTSFNKATPGHALGRDTATALSEVLSEAINTLSGGNKYVAGVFSPTPDQIDYLLGQLTGGVGREYSKAEQTLKSVARGESLPTYKIPLVGRFVGNAKGQASEGSAFYANVDKLNEIETEVNGLRQDGKDAEARKLLSENPEAYLITQANYAERQAQKLRRQKSELIKAGAPREQVKAVEEQITAVMARLNRAMERLKESAEATAQ